jgi:hypothetical protein
MPRMMQTVIVALWLAASSTPALPTAEAALERTLAHHDPAGVWASRPIELTVKVTYGERLAESRGYESRTDRIRVDNAAGRFELASDRGGDKVEVVGRGDELSARLNGSADIDAATLDKHRLNAAQLPGWRDYFAYVFGLPMKLSDPGTVLDPDTRLTEFEGRDVLALRVTYDPEVGRDIWYFYLDPESFALVGCRFFHDESKNDGEYIVYEGEIEGPNGLRLPKLRHWYVNAGGEFLATDDVVAVNEW